MAIFLSNDVQVTLNAVDLTDHVTSASISTAFLMSLRLQLWEILHTFL
jgi:hypothetical protein